MFKNPFFSVVIPTYNCADRLEKALDSVDRQTCRDFEVVICDSSSDHTKQIIYTYSGKLDIKYIWEASRGGPAGPRNSCIRIAKGDYIAFLDADDWWYPGKLASVKKFLEKYNPDILYHQLDIYNIQGKRGVGKIKARKLKSPVFIDLLKNTNPLFTSGVVAKKNIINMAGGFTEGDILEDFDLWLKIARLTENFRYLPKALGAYSMGGKSRSGASEKMISMVKAVYQKHINFLSHYDRQEVEMLICYLLGRMKQKLGATEEAMGLFRESAKTSSLKFKLRSFCWIFWLSFSRYAR